MRSHIGKPLNLTQIRAFQMLRIKSFECIDYSDLIAELEEQNAFGLLLKKRIKAAAPVIQGQPIIEISAHKSYANFRGISLSTAREEAECKLKTVYKNLDDLLIYGDRNKLEQDEFDGVIKQCLSKGIAQPDLFNILRYTTWFGVIPLGGMNSFSPQIFEVRNGDQVYFQYCLIYGCPIIDSDMEQRILSSKVFH